MLRFIVKTNGNASLMTVVLFSVILANMATANGFSLRQIFGGGKQGTGGTDGDEGKGANDMNDREPGMSGVLGRAADGDADGSSENATGGLMEKPLPDENMVDLDIGEHKSEGSVRSSGYHDEFKRPQTKGGFLGRRGNRQAVDGASAAAASEVAAGRRRDSSHSLRSSESGALSGRHETDSNGRVLSGEGRDRELVYDSKESGDLRESDNALGKGLGKDKDRYGGIRKEIEDLSYQLSRDHSGSTTNGHLHEIDGAHHAHGSIQTHEETHTLLARGIEDAIAGLMNVYKALRVPEAGSDEVGNTIAGHESHVLDNEHGTLGEAEAISVEVSHRKTNGEHRSASLRAPSLRNGGHSDVDGNWPADTSSKSNSIDGGEKFNQGTGMDTDYGENDGEVKAKTSVMGLGVVAGVIFIAAVGMVVMGYLRLRRERNDTHTQPLYPPRGPSFV